MHAHVCNPVENSADGQLAFPYEGSELPWCVAMFTGEILRQAFSVGKVGRVKFSSYYLLRLLYLSAFSPDDI